jgi:hypothetical protein
MAICTLLTRFAGKRTIPGVEEEANGDDEAEDYSYDMTEGDNASFNETDEAMQEQQDAVAASSAIGGHEEMEQDADSRPAEDATLANLFRSPAKVDYPELPHINANETVLETAMQDIVEQPKENPNVDETEPPVRDSQTINQALEALTEIQYPALPVDDMKSSSPAPSSQEDQATTDDSHKETPSTEPETKEADEDNNDDNDADEEDTPSSPEARDPEEEFTEASLQLDILRDYQNSMREHSSTSTQVDNFASGQDDCQVTEDDSEDDEEVDSVDDETRPATDEVATDSDSAESQDHVMDDAPTQDITDGLVLSLSPSKSVSSTSRKLHSPPPRPASASEDAPMAVAFDDDTAMLKDFLHRAAASKAEKAAISTHRRESLQNRRDSDVIRHALASPRKALEEKDPNSPAKHSTELTLDLSQTLTLSAPSEALSSPTPGVTEPEDADETSAKTTRRSVRAKKSRLPAPASTGPAPASKIAIRRNDGNEVVVLKKDDAKLLADLTRANTRKNKQGAFGVTVRLMKAQMDAISLPPIDDTTKEIVIGKNVRWDEQLTYYQENPETIAEAESLATPDELSFSDNGSELKKKKKEKTSKTSTPKVRRVRGLGTANGTPAKGLTAPSSLLPEAVKEEKEISQDKSASQKHQQIPKPKVAKVKKMPVATTSVDSRPSSNPSETKLPSLDVAPVGVGATTAPSSLPAPQRKSRLAAPKKVILSQMTNSVDGKENNTLRTGLANSTPKKGLPAPKVVVAHSAIATAAATAGMESGLPRRRGKKY